MNGFSLVLLGIVLIVVAYALIKIQGKMKEVTDAIDMGFRSIEDGITQNFLGPGGALTKATTAVTDNYATVRNGVEKNVLGAQGLVGKSKDIINFANNICTEVGNDIIDGKLVLQNDIRGTTKDIEKILQDTGVPLIDAGTWFNNIGNDIDVDIAGAHPFEGLAKPFRDVGKTCGDIGGLALLAESDLIRADNRIKLAEGSLQKISDNIKALGPQMVQLRDYVDNEFRQGVNTSMDDLGHLKDGVVEIFSAMEKGANLSVSNLKSANAALDSQLHNMVRRQYIVGLFSAGVLLILAGVALGI